MAIQLSVWLLMLVAVMLCCTIIDGADIAYDWKPLKLGGGGFITGIDSDASGTITVVRTDTYGAYIKNGTSSWRQLVTATSLNTNSMDWAQKGVNDIKIAPSDPNRIYMQYNWQFWRSTNGGRTFLPSVTGGFTNDYNTHISGFRYHNNRIAVDPINPNVVYYGTWDNGLMLSTDGGVNFVKANTLGTGLPNKAGYVCQSTNQLNGNCDDKGYMGVNGIAFAPNGAVVNGRSQTIIAFLTSTDPNYMDNCDPANPAFYTAGACTGGVYKTTNGGISWYRLGVHTWDGVAHRNKPVQYLMQSAMGADGKYYFISRIENQLRTFRIETDNNFRDITPNSTPKTIGEPEGYYAIAVGKQIGNAGWVILSDAYGQMVQSHNFGEPGFWSTRNNPPTGITNEIPWLSNMFGGYLTTGSLMFDKSSNDAQLWFTNGVGVWKIALTNPATTNVVFNSVNIGIEQVVTRNIIATTSTVIGALWDWNTITFTNPDTYSNNPGSIQNWQTGGIMTSWDIDNPQDFPNFFVSISVSQVDANLDRSGYSTNGGQSWSTFGSIPNAGIPFQRGQIAATTDQHFMWLVPSGKGLYYSTNQGSTWSKVTRVYDYDYSGHGGQGGQLVSDETFWNGLLDNNDYGTQRLSASKGPYPVDKTVFQFYHTTKGIFSSIYDTNTGEYWFKCVYPNVWISGTTNVASIIIKHIPAVHATLLISSGHDDAGRLSISESYGWGFTPFAGISAVITFGFGKAPPNTTTFTTTGLPFPTIYVIGKYNGEQGIWRSGNKGTSWDRITPMNPLDSLDLITAIDGDKNVYGKIYIGFNGSGFAYGVTI